jgi:hypothetical protein
MLVIATVVFERKTTYIIIDRFLIFCTIQKQYKPTYPIMGVSALTWFIRYIYYNSQFLNNVIVIKTEFIEHCEYDIISYYFNVKRGESNEGRWKTNVRNISYHGVFVIFHGYEIVNDFIKLSLEDGQTMTKRQRSKRQTMIYKTNE